MNRFIALFEALDATRSTNGKVAALAEYFRSAPPADAAWALTFLSGRALRRHVSAGLLVRWAAELARAPDWLVSECYGDVGDLAELIALLLDTARANGAPTSHDAPLADWLEQRILPLKDLDEPSQRAQVVGWWSQLSRTGVFLLNKLLTGEFRVGASQTLVLRAVAEVAGLAREVIVHRFMATWEPSAESFAKLILPEGGEPSGAQPYPFYLASPLAEPVEHLGEATEWLCEWKWDGIRAQVIRRDGEVHIWSRGEERITDRFPEVREAARALPEGTVLDGEILAWRGRPLPFAELQRRIGRTELTSKVLAEAPAVLMAFDLLENAGRDVRALALRERRARLEHLVAGDGALRLSEALRGTWDELGRLRESSRSRGVEGLMLKKLDGPYRSGRPRGEWWKWKIAPYTLDAVLIRAQPGNGRRARLLTDYTFGVWRGEELVPIAKAYSGLSDAEIAEIDAWIRAHTLERFGPVRRVAPERVFELAFEGIARSSRHASGIAVRFPRIVRQRLDKRAQDADTLQRVEELLRIATRSGAGE